MEDDICRKLVAEGASPEVIRRVRDLGVENVDWDSLELNGKISRNLRFYIGVKIVENTN